MSDDAPPDGFQPREWVTWIRQSNHTAIKLLRETASSALLVLLIGLVLFGASGVWPPMVAVESGSMEPHMERGDLIFVMEEQRLAPEFATADTGVVTHRTGESKSFRKSDDYGDVIVFRPDGKASETPIIHRARFWVNDSENWYDDANPEYLPGDSCTDIPNCPAPNAGFVTLGDNNRHYDQAIGRSRPVRPTWIHGTAEVRVPFLGHVRLALQ
jgi:signal peptidase